MRFSVARGNSRWLAGCQPTEYALCGGRATVELRLPSGRPGPACPRWANGWVSPNRRPVLCPRAGQFILFRHKPKQLNRLFWRRRALSFDCARAARAPRPVDGRCLRIAAAAYTLLCYPLSARTPLTPRTPPRRSTPGRENSVSLSRSAATTGSAAAKDHPRTCRHSPAPTSRPTC